MVVLPRAAHGRPLAALTGDFAKHSPNAWQNSSRLSLSRPQAVQGVAGEALQGPENKGDLPSRPAAANAAEVQQGERGSGDGERNSAKHNAEQSAKRAEADPDWPR